MQFYDDTTLMVLLCRHDRVLWLVNMHSMGEKQFYREGFGFTDGEGLSSPALYTRDPDKARRRGKPLQARRVAAAMDAAQHNKTLGSSRNNTIKAYGHPLSLLRMQWAKQVRAQKKPQARPSKTVGQKAVAAAVLASRDAVAIHNAQVTECEASVLDTIEDDSGNNIVHCKVALETVQAALKKSKERLTHQELALGVGDRAALTNLAKSKYLELRMNVQALKTRLRDRLRARKFEHNRVERPSRCQQTSDSAMKWREPQISRLKNHYNKLCDAIDLGIKHKRGPCGAVAPERIESKDVGLQDEEEQEVLLWLSINTVRSRIWAMLALDRSKQLAKECESLQMWFAEEWTVFNEVMSRAVFHKAGAPPALVRDWCQYMPANGGYAMGPERPYTRSTRKAATTPPAEFPPSPISSLPNTSPGIPTSSSASNTLGRIKAERYVSAPHTRCTPKIATAVPSSGFNVTGRLFPFVLIPPKRYRGAPSNAPEADIEMSSPADALSNTEKAHYVPRRSLRASHFFVPQRRPMLADLFDFALSFCSTALKRYTSLRTIGECKSKSDVSENRLGPPVDRECREVEVHAPRKKNIADNPDMVQARVERAAPAGRFPNQISSADVASVPLNQSKDLMHMVAEYITEMELAGLRLKRTAEDRQATESTNGNPGRVEFLPPRREEKNRKNATVLDKWMALCRGACYNGKPDRCNILVNSTVRFRTALRMLTTAEKKYQVKTQDVDDFRRELAFEVDCIHARGSNGQTHSYHPGAQVLKRARGLDAGCRIINQERRRMMCAGWNACGIYEGVEEQRKETGKLESDKSRFWEKVMSRWHSAPEWYTQ
ncbi:hypothetical protein B0H17DRAFT_1136182 [Mycena rosella]|uniref:Uncharacterized protein n=1 Tax=Mycena rosella TaxID=1033263 RepID=A0AAD7GES4_MYCRO|nr:hypothetical protein B0H17DRAFT_1136182 [Mycena rosella]